MQFTYVNFRQNVRRYSTCLIMRRDSDELSKMKKTLLTELEKLL